MNDISSGKVQISGKRERKMTPKGEQFAKEIKTKQCSSIDALMIPKTYKQALNSPESERWREAIMKQ